MAMAENHMGLSPRERQIADLLLQGCENGEIAKLLKMKRRTVKAHMNRLFRRFEIKDGIKRVKLATLLYRGLCVPNIGLGGLPTGQKNRPSNATLTSDLTLSSAGMAEWRTPAVELQTNREENFKMMSD
jgi:Bacterial regulatory proteins, luxR family